METKKVLAHSCLKREQGFTENDILPAGCRCRLFVTLSRAQELINNGEAANVAVLRKVVPVEEPCTICGQDPVFVKSCTNCDKTGIVKSNDYRIIRGEDIVFVSNLKKTPRTATIEKAHIERTFEGHRNEGVRTDFYEILTVEFLNSLGATVYQNGRVVEDEFIDGKLIRKGKSEPTDDPQLHTGREYDYGRPV